MLLVSIMLAAPVDRRRGTLPRLDQFDDLVLVDHALLSCALQQLVPNPGVDTGDLLIRGLHAVPLLPTGDGDVAATGAAMPIMLAR